MKFSIRYLVVLVALSCMSFAQQGPQGRSFGFGIVVGEPYGLTGKFWSGSNAVALSVGGSYYGSLRFGGDYLWHFNTFNSSQFNMYVGPGIVLGIGSFHNGWYYNQDRWSRENGTVGLGVRGVMGIDFMPRNSPIEMFLEAGPLINVSPGSFSAFDMALGIRIYP